MVAKATPQMESAGDEPRTSPDSPLLDLAGAGIKKMIKLATKLGYVTFKHLNTVMHLEKVTSEKDGHSGDV